MALAGQRRDQKADGKKKPADERKEDKARDRAEEKTPTGYTIKAGEPARTATDLPDRQDQGRILGSLKRCPGCTIEARNAEGLTVGKTSVKRGDPEYQLDWMRPGTYTVAISGGGALLFRPNVVVEAGHYTRIDIEFVPGTDAKPDGSSKFSDIEQWPTWKPPAEPKIPVPNFEPKSAKELERIWDTDDGKNKSRRARRKGKRRGKRK